MIKINSYKTVKETKTDIIQLENWREVDEFIHRFSKTSWLIDQQLKNLPELQLIENIIWLEAGEHLKTLGCLEQNLTKIYKQNLDRNSCIIAVGGGSVSDFAGFIASIYLRGVNFISIPSTFLSLKMNNVLYLYPRIFFCFFQIVF